MASRRPYYRRVRPRPQDEEAYAGHGRHVDLSKVTLPASPDPGSAVRVAQEGFEARAAAYVRARVAPGGTYVPDVKHPQDESKGTFYGPVQVVPEVEFEGPGGPQKSTSGQPRDLLERKHYGVHAPTVHLVTSKCLAALAYGEFFPKTLFRGLEALTAQAVLAAGPGWCGSIGPSIDDVIDVVAAPKTEGNYDMNQMYLLAMAYRYVDELEQAAAYEHLVTVLLARGRIHRVSLGDTFTSGGAPEDWGRAGTAAGKRIGETENHQLMMMTVRYLTNQLLYQREAVLPYDNRRNDPRAVATYVRLVAQEGVSPVTATLRVAEKSPSEPSGGSCTAILLSLLRSFLWDDFSEYNAKNYQNETRQALVNLCSYAYDHEVRLAARMVLDYLSAHMAVSSSDLRRLLPFRRRNEHGRSARDGRGFMKVPLINSNDADPMAPFFALHTGNLRAYERATGTVDGRSACHVAGHGGDQLLDALGDYRLPPSVHDLFVNDAHRRFFQRLHRTVIAEDWLGDPHNADNMELFAGSPSYLLTAGGEGADYAIDPRYAGIVLGDQEQQLGVAVTTTFLPTVRRAGADTSETDPWAANAGDLVQFSGFAAGSNVSRSPLLRPIVRNYGVGPDFLCGQQVHLPRWLTQLRGSAAYQQAGAFTFIDKGSSQDGKGSADGPGFYLALYQQDGLACMEAFDTWLDPRVSFQQFTRAVLDNNSPVANGGTFELVDGAPTRWTTYTGTRLHLVIWNGKGIPTRYGAEILDVEQYSALDPRSAAGDAGNTRDVFLSGTVLRSRQAAVVTISNPGLGTTITLDMSNHLRPRRTGEDGSVEQAGGNAEVWVDFGCAGLHRGDVCQPFGTLAQASAGVAAGGTLRLVPGRTGERTTIGAGKAMRLVAPIGGVTIGS